MARERKLKIIEHKCRLKELKQILKPHQNSHSVNILRLITRLSSARLDNYLESLEFTENKSCRVVKECVQDVVNRILEYGEYAKPKTGECNTRMDMINNRLKRLHIVRYRNIDSKVNMYDSIKHININSRLNMFNSMRHNNMDLIENEVVDGLKHLNINSKANTVVDGFKNLIIDKLEHFHINGCPPI